MYNITIGRYDADPEAQGVVRPADDSWQLVIDKDGFPHLYVSVKVGGDETGLLAIEDLLPDDLTIPDLMKSTFDGELEGEEAEAAARAYAARKGERRIPCPR